MQTDTDAQRTAYTAAAALGRDVSEINEVIDQFMVGLITANEAAQILHGPGYTAEEGNTL